MWLEFIGETLDIIGKILVAITAIAVHDSVIKERRIDEQVNRTIRKEHVYGFLGIVFMVAGYILRQLARHAS